jgi:TetR/AcrR family transcriptional regulator, transcriptional repressor for nem operon
MTISIRQGSDLPAQFERGRLADAALRRLPDGRIFGGHKLPRSLQPSLSIAELQNRSIDDICHPISMRYSASHKQDTRRKIVRSASRHVRNSGGKGVAIAELMKQLKLTHGGFYKHFKSKEQLLAEAVAQAFDETEGHFNEIIRNARPGAELRALIEHYLSMEHCADRSTGCPMAALASEAGRLPRTVRLEIDRAIKRRVTLTARFLPGATEQERERKCMALLSGLVGTVSIARAVVNLAEREALLEAARDFYIGTLCE